MSWQLGARDEIATTRRLITSALSPGQLASLAAHLQGILHLVCRLILPNPPTSFVVCRRMLRGCSKAL